jgi:hypothetical protein
MTTLKSKHQELAEWLDATLVIFNNMSIHEHLCAANRHVEAALLIEASGFGSISEIDQYHGEELGDADNRQDGFSQRLMNATNAIQHELNEEDFKAFNLLSNDARREWAQLVVNGISLSTVASRFRERDVTEPKPSNS